MRPTPHITSINLPNILAKSHLTLDFEINHLHALPSTNWLRLDELRWKLLTRNVSAGDVYANDNLLTDLLLPNVDNPYSVRDVVDTLNASRLHVSRFWPSAVYDVETHLQTMVASGIRLDEHVLGTIEALDYVDRCAIAEDVGGNLQQHWFYAHSHDPAPSVGVASPSDLSLVPVLVSVDAEALANRIRTIGGGRLSWQYQSTMYEFEFSEAMLRVLEAIDGVRTIGEIFAALRLDERRPMSVDALANGWVVLFVRLNGIHQLFLSSKGFSGNCRVGSCTTRSDNI